MHIFVRKTLLGNVGLFALNCVTDFIPTVTSDRVLDLNCLDNLCLVAVFIPVQRWT